jgi:hypothetical protein
MIFMMPETFKQELKALIDKSDNPNFRLYMSITYKDERGTRSIGHAQNADLELMALSKETTDLAIKAFIARIFKSGQGMVT